MKWIKFSTQGVERMSTKGTKKKLNKKKKLARTFLRAMLGTGLICIIAIVSLVGCYNYFFKEEGTSNKPGKNQGATKKEEKLEDIYKNVAVFGVDKDGYRTDVIFVVNFNSETNKVKVLSVPRDTKVTWSEEQKQSLRDLGKGVRTVSKINEMTAYGGIENIRDFTINELERMLGVTIDNYVIFNIKAFNEIVDAIGGVDLYVPQDMKHTDYAGELFIDLKEGQQHLDGDKAEQFVRFRSYPNGDVDRVAAQQVFLRAFADKLLSPSIITKIPKLVSIVFNSITTDINLTEIPQYYQYINNFNGENISFHILPGEGRYEGGASYFFPDLDALDAVIQEVFFDTVPAGQEPVEEEVVIDKEVSITILNGSGITGAAGRARDQLVEQGYTVSEVGNYQTHDVVTTMVIAKDETKAKQFLTYYPNAQITQDETIATDIQIVIGTDIETSVE